MRSMDMTVTNDQLQSLKNQYMPALIIWLKPTILLHVVLVYFNTKLLDTYCENYR